MSFGNLLKNYLKDKKIPSHSQGYHQEANQSGQKVPDQNENVWKPRVFPNPFVKQEKPI